MKKTISMKSKGLKIGYVVIGLLAIASIGLFSWSGSLYADITSPPPTPSLTGPSSGVVGAYYTYPVTIHAHTVVGYGDTMIYTCGINGYGSRGVYVPSTDVVVSFNCSWPTPGTYYVKVEVQQAGGLFSNWSTPIGVTIVPDTVAPTVPSNSGGGASSTTQIDLTLGGSTDNVSVTGFKIYRNDSFLASVNAITPDSGNSYASYSDKGLSPSTTYNYTFAAYDAAGNVSAQTSSIPLTTYALPDTSDPTVPKGLKATASLSQINLSWSASSDNVEVVGYRIYRNDNYIADATSTSFSDNNLAAGDYTYNVVAYDAAGNVSAKSSPSSATIIAVIVPPEDVDISDNIAPSIPANLGAVATASTQVTLTWNTSIDDVGVVGYKIYRNGTYLASSTDTLYFDNSVKAATSYSYTITAYDAAGNVSPQSSSVSVTTQSANVIDNNPLPSTTDTVAPSKPTGLYAAVASSSQINLSWTASTDNVAVIAYKIYRDGVAINSTTKTLYSDLGLSPGISYKYTVAAYDAAGNFSLQSNSLILATAFDATTTAVPGPTTTVPVTPGSATNKIPGPTTTVPVPVTTPATKNVTIPPAGFEDKVVVNPEDYKNPFPDTEISSLEGKAAAELYRRAVIGGYVDGEFKGYREVNRAEAAKFLLLTEFETVEDLQNTGKFRDVAEGEWYVKYVVKAANLGIIQGYKDGNFKPQNTVTTAEFLKMLTKTFGLEENLNYTYEDVKSTDWFAIYAGTAQKYDLFPGKTTNLDPGKNLTRDQVAVAIYQYLRNR